MKTLLLYEVEFNVSFEGSYDIINFEAYDPGSRVDGVVSRREYDAEGRFVKDQPCLLIRDFGYAGAQPSCRRYAVVVRRMGRATPVPECAGPFVGRFVTENGRWEWYLFGPRPERLHDGQRPRGAPVAPSPPPPAKAEARSAPEATDAFEIPD